MKIRDEMLEKKKKRKSLFF